MPRMIDNLGQEVEVLPGRVSTALNVGYRHIPASQPYDPARQYVSAVGHYASGNRKTIGKYL